METYLRSSLPDPRRSAELMTVVEVSRRTGVTRKALRLYERLNLVRPVERTAAGYRLYDAEALRRLGLIARAKSLGLTLAETEEFIAAADGCCGDDQSELAALVERKLAETRSQVTALQARGDRLSAVLARLADNGSAGGCDETLCTCQAPGGGACPTCVVASQA